MGHDDVKIGGARQSMKRSGTIKMAKKKELDNDLMWWISYNN